jgi:hypothetical protein
VVAKNQLWADVEEEVAQAKPSPLEAAILFGGTSKEEKSIRLRVFSLIPALNSSEQSVRIGAMEGMLNLFVDSTKVTRTDVRTLHRKGVSTVVGDRESQKLKTEAQDPKVSKPAAKTDTRKSKGNAKAELEKAVMALRQLHPKAEDQVAGSVYATEVAKLRRAYKEKMSQAQAGTSAKEAE